jgi:hypothetical protein
MLPALVAVVLAGVPHLDLSRLVTTRVVAEAEAEVAVAERVTPGTVVVVALGAILVARVTRVILAMQALRPPLLLLTVRLSSPEVLIQ